MNGLGPKEVGDKHKYVASICGSVGKDNDIKYRIYVVG